LIGGKGVNREEAFRVTGESIGCDHLDPGVDAVVGVLALALLEILTPSVEFAKCLRMEEGEEVFIEKMKVSGGNSS